MQKEIRDTQVTVPCSPPADTETAPVTSMLKKNTQIPGWPFVWWALSEQEIFVIVSTSVFLTQREKSPVEAGL